MKGLVREFFRKQFQKRKRVKVYWPSDFLTSKLGDEDGIWLTREFSEEEMRSAVWDCGGSKSPEPDGFNMEFYRECWDTIKVDLCRVLLQRETCAREQCFFRCAYTEEGRSSGVESF